jgi:hypothetical protein
MMRIALLITGAAFMLSAQTREEFEVRVPGPPDALKHKIEFIRSEFGGAVGPVVKNAPYSAEAVSEHVQVLADGNRIVHKDSSQVARDSEGRTRRDMAVPALGPLAANGPKLSVIFDPVTNVSYTLDHKAKTARKMPGKGVAVFDTTTDTGPGVPIAGAAAVSEEKRMGRMEVAHSGVVHASEDVVMAAPIAVARMRTSGTAKTESLGKQNIEGVVAEGTRNTEIIPAGEMGNERPIEIVSERWYSPELQTVVMTRHKDPRMGESTYKLTNIRRTEPLKSLFEVPPDYAVKETPLPGR